jgi:lysozyme
VVFPYLPPPWDQDSQLLSELVYCEGCRAVPYRDTRGNLTGGVGWNITANGLPSWAQLAGGRLEPAAILGLYALAVANAETVLDHLACAWWRQADPVRQRALINLAFNLGERLAEFPHFLGDMKGKSYALAATELQQSQPWYSEVGHRGPLLVSMIRDGITPAIPVATAADLH